MCGPPARDRQDEAKTTTQTYMAGTYAETTARGQDQHHVSAPT